MFKRTGVGIIKKCLIDSHGREKKFQYLIIFEYNIHVVCMCEMFSRRFMSSYICSL